MGIGAAIRETFGIREMPEAMEELQSVTYRRLNEVRPDPEPAKPEGEKPEGEEPAEPSEEDGESG